MKILGHRGVIADGDTPFQNTVAAFDYALQQADGFETDACIASDGEIFLIHEKSSTGHYSITPYLDDDSVHKLGERQLADLNSAEIKQLRLLNGNPIPTLHEAMRLYLNQPDKILNIELKSYDVEKHIAHHLEKAFTEGIIEPSQVIISSFNHASVTYLQDKLPHVKFGALFTDIPREDGDHIYPWIVNSPTYRGVNPENIARCVDTFDYLMVPVRQVTGQLMRGMPKGKVIPWVSSGDEDFKLHEFIQALSGYENLFEMIIINNPAERL